MNSLPIFVALRGRRVAFVGDGAGAASKLDVLRRAGAEVVLLDGAAVDESDAFAGAALAFVALDDPDAAAWAAAAARRAGVPVNAIDRPALSTFTMGAIVERAPFLIAISSGGAAPSLARRVRALVERALPASLGRLATLMADLRDAARETLRSASARRRFFDALADGPVARLLDAGRDADARREAIRALAEATRPAAGVVHLVGAGPGDPELLTLKAHRLLQTADVIVHDRLASEAVLDLARRDAERIFVGKARAKHCVPQSEINALLVSLARAGKTVVRLKGGDPFVFGRGGEELEALASAEVPFEVVPGVTAATGCAAYAGIPLTHRDMAQSCVFVTGHIKNGELALDWATLAKPAQTLAIYMGVETLPTLAARLVEHGRSADTPAALVENGGTRAQRVVVGTLATLPGLVAAAPPIGPALTIVGETVRLHAAFGRPGAPADTASPFRRLDAA